MLWAASPGRLPRRYAGPSASAGPVRSAGSVGLAAGPWAWPGPTRAAAGCWACGRGTAPELAGWGKRASVWGKPLGFLSQTAGLQCRGAIGGQRGRKHRCPAAARWERAETASKSTVLGCRAQPEALCYQGSKLGTAGGPHSARWFGAAWPHFVLGSRNTARAWYVCCPVGC